MQTTQTHPDIPILFEDQHLLVVNKPHNLLSQGDETGDPDAITLIRQYLQRTSESRQTPYVGLVHRLDRPVGGLMLLAKTSQAASDLSRQMRNRLMTKTYWAVTNGTPPTNGVLTHYLQKDREKNIVSTSSGSNPAAKEAILSFAKLETADPLHLLSVHLQTGRPHQIRVQLSAEGYPIWGDYKYGLNQPDGRTIALRAVELIFNHPKTNEQVQFELAPPASEPWGTFSNIVFK